MTYRHLTPADKMRWAAAKLAAENLAKGMADCDQADFLRQFVICGNDVAENNPEFSTSVTKLQAIPLTN